MKYIIYIFSLLIVSIQLSGQTNDEHSLDSFYQTVKMRNIGPFKGGRSVAASGVYGKPTHYYMGTVGGGLWKTEDAGQYWKNISDGFFKTPSVGVVAVAQSNSNIVYCGMGEHAPRGVMTSYGDGVYKSTDAGKTWKHMGLAPTQHISRIVIHPTNPDIVYVAAQGALHEGNKERGIYKSTDGGSTWEQVLYVNKLTGCSELSMDANNPEVLYAAMWEHQRKPWIVVSGGDGSGLYKSIDGGASWKEMKKGLPKEKGKTAIAVAATNSNKVYALVESDSNKEKGGLFVSNDAGDSWSRVSKDHRLVQRAWYYIELFIDPTDEETVYVLSAPALRSIDGGKTWSGLSGTHGDYHDLWINPQDKNNMVIANDGGAAISFNYGKSWSTQLNMPTSQLYRVNVDNAYPYNIYAGQQDYPSMVMANMEIGSGNITSKGLFNSAGGESAFLAFDPDNPGQVMGGSYLGTIDLLDTKAKAGTNIMAAPIQYLGREARDMKYLFNWNAPVIWSQHEPDTYYHGSQYLLRTRDLGQTWEEVSPDLTRNIDTKQGNGGGPYTNEAVGAENYGTLAYVVESPHEKGVIYTGSDDGYVQITKDGGENWSNVTPKGLEECLINAIEVSPHDPATAYIATTRYKFNDKRPGLYKTTNYGKSWTKITSGIPDDAYTRVVREDTEVKGLLFTGTETGLFISYDDGSNWNRFQLNLPVTPITDMIIRHDDLIIATAGRSFWILDDMGLIRQVDKNETPFVVYTPEDAVIGNWGSPLNSTSVKFKGTNPLYGVNPANGVVLYYNLPKIADSVHISAVIKNAKGDVIRTLSSKKNPDYKKYDGGPGPEPVLSKKKGLNRYVWDMRHQTLVGAPKAYIEGSFRGHKTIPGDYTFELSYGDKNEKTSFKILANPNYPTDAATYQEYEEQMTMMESNFNAMHTMLNANYKKMNQLSSIIKQLKKDETHTTLVKEGKALVAKMKAWDEDMVQRKSQAYDDVENFPNKFTAEYIFLINQTESDIPRVTQPSKDRLRELTAQWDVLKKRGVELLEKEVPAMNQKLWKAGVGALFVE